MKDKDKILELKRIVKETPNNSTLGIKLRALFNEWFKPTNKPKIYPTFELLNSEGPILVIKRTPDHFLIFDEWGFMIARMSAETLLNFINGKSTLIDTQHRLWNYKEQSEGMKGNHDELMAFVEPLIKK